jgi:hypothetical protein
MSLVTVIHPEEKRQVSVHQVITKCDLFENNARLLDAPYAVRSSVSVDIFQQFVSALERNEVEITDTNIDGLFQLCKEFNFRDLRTKLSEFRPNLNVRESQVLKLTAALPPLHNAHFSDSFAFITNGVMIESNVAEAVGLSPVVKEQLSVDGCARKFIVNNNEIGASDIRSLHCLLSGQTICFEQSQVSMSRLLENPDLELLFLGCSREGIQMTLLDLSMEIANLSVEALDSLLLK